MVAGTGVVLETVRKANLTCTGATGNGEYTGPKSIGNVTVVLTGCISSGLECNTEGANEGEVRIAGLEGELGWENQALRKVAEDLFPAGKPESIEQVSCGGVPVAMRGSVLSSIKAGSMLSLATVKYVQKAGKQKPEKLEGEPRDVLEMSIAAGPFEQAGETANLTRTNEEKIEANWLA
jgi:hypothetical protein